MLAAVAVQRANCKAPGVVKNKDLQAQTCRLVKQSVGKHTHTYIHTHTYTYTHTYTHNGTYSHATRECVSNKVR